MFVVAGVTGHVGRAVAETLLDHKERVRVLVRDAKKGEAWSKRGAEVTVAELDDEAAVTNALKGAKGFFTLLPPSFAEPDMYAYQRRVADRVSRAVKAAAVPHVVLLSSVGADVAEGHGPIRGVHYFENVLRATGTVLTSMRATLFMENVYNLLDAARGAGIYPSFVPSPDYAVPRIATRDIGALAADELRAPTGKSENVVLVGPASSENEVAQKLGKRLGKQLTVVTIPPAGFVDALKQGGMSQAHAEIFAEMYAAFGSGRLAPNGDRTREGKSPIDSVIDGIPASA